MQLWSIMSNSFIFFFSSRRRHTRYIGDWSSDVCSSDLSPLLRRREEEQRSFVRVLVLCVDDPVRLVVRQTVAPDRGRDVRSEERRVGKGCRCRWATVEDTE